MYKSVIKHTLDFFISLFGLIFFFPLLFCITIFVALKTKGQPFFSQERPGLNEKIFTLIKFTTMTDKRDETGKLLPNKYRMTSWGSFLRKTSLDELPQLWNVLKGEMSFVGPRPLRIDYLSLYSEEEKKRHTVRPGITGWAQVNGRDELPIPVKVELDYYYLINRSFKLDIKILFRTIFGVIRSEGVVEGKHTDQ